MNHYFVGALGAGVLHEERQGDREEGGAHATRWLLSYCRNDELTGT